MAWWTSATVLARTPPRPWSTRSTVASDNPAWTAISRIRYGCPTPTIAEGFLRDRQGLTDGIAAVNLDMSKQLTKESDVTAAPVRPIRPPGPG